MEDRSAHNHVIVRGIWVLVFAVEAWFYCCFGCLDQERTALLDLKNSFNSTTSLDSWEAGTDCCHWERVNCNRVTGRVIELSLGFVRDPSKGSGYWYLNASLLLPFKELKNLEIECNLMRGFTDSKAFERWSKMTELEDLDLRFNRLNETILPFVCALKSLKYLQIQLREIQHSPPTVMAELITCLRELEGLDFYAFGVHSNYTGGSIPSSIESMTSLKALGLADNRLNDSHSIQGLCKLKSLRELDLSFNEFEGEVPFCLSNLTNLRLLHLTGNRFSGNIPTSIFSGLKSLEYLFLAHNNFSGLLELSSFAHLSKLRGVELVCSDYLEVQTEHPLWVPTFQLEILDLSNCNINKPSSVIPSFLLTQQSLIELDLSHNKLKGNFPVWLLKNNTRLECFILKNNSFTGTFHLLSHHFNSGDLLALDISNNQVSGMLPTNMGSLLPKLSRLNMSGNYLQGKIPLSIGDMRNLEYLDLSHNNIIGEIPEPLLANCVSLKLLKLSNNRLYGQIFPAYSNVTDLEHLYLDSNHFTGSILPGLFRSSFLEILDVGDNQMSGELVSQIGDFPSLRGLILRGNHFEGPIPSKFCKLKGLKFLDLSKNNFNESIPSCLNLSSLNYIHLEKNSFSGHIPSALLESSSLVTLDIRNNHIDGVIPTLIGNLLNLRVLLMSRNHLYGTIPFELCQLKNLNLLDLSHNNLSGSLPSCISNLAFGSSASQSQDNLFQIDLSLEIYFFTKKDYGDFLPLLSYISYDVEFNVSEDQQEVEFITKSRSNSYKGYILNYLSGIDLSCNQLIGEIPVEMGHLSSLYSLNLSYNQFTGQMPATFSNLRKIECLDFSYNKLNGTIPTQLIELYFLSSFTVAHNNLSGKTPNMVFQFATFSESSYEGNPLLCGPPLKKNCTSNIHTNTIQGREEKDDNDGYLVSFYASFLGSYCIFLLGTIVVLYYSRERSAICFLRSVDSWRALHLYKICRFFYCK